MRVFGTIFRNSSAPTVDQAFVWTVAGGLQVVTSPSGAAGLVFYSTSPLGAGLGTARFTVGGNRNFVWTAIHGFQFVPQLQDISFYSDDGSRIAGTYAAPCGSYPCQTLVWTKGVGTQILPPLPGHDRTNPAALSPDGSTVVGSS